MTQGGTEAGFSAGRPTPIYKDLVLLQLVALVFLLDQLTKYVVRAYIPYRHSFPEDGFLRITHTFNTGSAFGLFQGQNTPLILVSLVGITVLALVYRSQPRSTNLLRLSLGLQMGGAAGNLLDRLRLGHVTDFIDVGPWPVFNLADSSIVIGLVLLAWLFLRPGGVTGRPPVPATPAGDSTPSPADQPPSTVEPAPPGGDKQG
jgi:signal peptidase II